MSRNSLLVILSASLLLNTVGCVAQPTQAPPQQPTAAPPSLKVAGSGGASAVVQFLAEAYGKQHNDLAFEFLSGSSSSGAVKGVLDGTLGLGTMSRPPKDSEMSQGIAYVKVGADKVVVVTSADLAISNLTAQQAKDIFLGKITNWSEVGGPDAPVNILVREEEESSTQVLRAALFGDEAFAASAVIFTSEGDMRKALSKAVNAIGFLAYSGVRLTQPAVHVLALDGRDPADKGGGYPYTRQLGMVYLPANAASVQPFIDYLKTSEAQALMAELGMIPAQ